MHPVQRLKNRDESIDNVVQFEDPDESNLAASAEDIIIWDFALPTGMVQLLIGRQLHKIIVKRYEQFLTNENIQVLRLGLNLIMFELTRPCEYLDLLIQNDIADVELAYFTDLNQHHHYFQLAAAAALLLELLYYCFEQGLLVRLFAFLLEEQEGFGDGLGCKGVRDQVQLFQLFQVGVLFEESVHQLHPCLFIYYFLWGDEQQLGNRQLQCGQQRPNKKYPSNSDQMAEPRLDVFNKILKQDMQGSRIQGRSNWKQAVKKDNPIQSRIFGENKDLPNKFSPSRLANIQGSSRSLIRHRTSNYSHDEINIAAIMDPQERSISKDGKLERKDTLKTPKSVKGESQLQMKPGMMSEKSIDFEINRMAAKPSNFKSGDIDIVRELKLEFLRFKERILKELKRQQEEFTRTLRIINERISNLQDCTESPIQFKSSPSAFKASNILSPQMQAYQSPISKYLQALNKQMPVTSQTSSYKNLKIQQILSQDSVTPQIKERMSRMDQLLGALKRDLNQQLPVGQNEQIVASSDI